jgi:hypothetical protein
MIGCGGILSFIPLRRGVRIEEYESLPIPLEYLGRPRRNDPLSSDSYIKGTAEETMNSVEADSS